MASKIDSNVKEYDRMLAPQRMVNEKVVQNTIRRCRERGIVVPTFAQLRDPSTIPQDIQDRLRKVGTWDFHPLNLFRCHWHNREDGSMGGVNYLEVPKEFHGLKCRIIALVGKNFPTGAHKVGPSFGCLAPRLVQGTFDPTEQKAVWPSTGNYCRGGAFNGVLLGCESVAILPEDMSQERFEWLKGTGAEVIATPGCESNVKEIYDKCHELRRDRGDHVVVFNQFDEFGNGMWHYNVTGEALLEVLRSEEGLRKDQTLFGFVSATGSAGTIATGDRLKEEFPAMKIAASEALQCPTLLNNGYGGHRIEGIGDKHVPWIHNVRNTDCIVAPDDADGVGLFRLTQTEAGHRLLRKKGVPEDFIAQLKVMGISGCHNLISTIKMAKYYECDEHDVLCTVFTDSAAMYGSRLKELEEELGVFTDEDAAVAFALHLRGLKADNVLELTHTERRRIHNLKYYTWVEQQGKDVAELDAQWYDWKTYWPRRWRLAEHYDQLIDKFNADVKGEEDA